MHSNAEEFTSIIYNIISTRKTGEGFFVKLDNCILIKTILNTKKRG